MNAFQFLVGWGLRSTALIAAAAAIVWLLRLRNPFTRMAVWTITLAGSLALPLLTVTLPALPVTVWHSVSAPAYPIETVVVNTVSGNSSGAVFAQPAAATRVRSVDWTYLPVAAYGLIAGVLLFRLLVGLIGSTRIRRRSAPTELSVEGAEVRESSLIASPVTIGVIRSTVLLPLDWPSWNDATRRAALEHEASHIRRRDPALQLVSAIHRALLWASPASWWLHRSIVRAAEEICDEAAISATGDRVSYARTLLEFVQRSVPKPRCAGVAMASYERPEKRIRRILDTISAPAAVSRRSIAGIAAVGVLGVWFTAAARPQEKEDRSQARLAEFEVATIKPRVPDVPTMMGVQVFPGGRVLIRAFPLQGFIMTAFGVSPRWQISGGEKWTREGEYTIEAKPPASMVSRIRSLRYTNFNIEDPLLREMLQSLLIDRFHLKFHRETKTGDVYILERNGQPFQPQPVELMKAGSDPYSEDHSFGSIGYAGGKWNIFATSMPQLADFASGIIVHAPVLDQTGIAGRFNYRQREPDLDPVYSGDQSPSFTSYLKEVGLKLTRVKGPVEMFVIDHAEKPTIE